VCTGGFDFKISKGEWKQCGNAKNCRGAIPASDRVFPKLHPVHSFYVFLLEHGEVICGVDNFSCAESFSIARGDKDH
jgi:hypothetical protein